MRDIQTALESVVRSATAGAFGQQHSAIDPLLRPVKDPRFGDFQANLAMPLGKQLGLVPKEVAQRIAQHIERADLLSNVEVAGPGFINLTVSERLLERAMQALLQDPRLGVVPVANPEGVVIDYASPNCAKEMHIGHLRSSIIGDAISRVLEFRGEHVIRQNHLGDWGTQFGMLLEHLAEQGWSPTSAAGASIHDLDDLYRQAKQRFDGDAEFAGRARARVVKLQAGDEPSMQLWQSLITESVKHMNEVFATLGVRLTDRDIRPESFYNSRLGAVVDDLRALQLLVESEGAWVVFADGFKDREGEPLPMIVQKRDGGFGYAATDLAAARFRVNELGAQRVIYVVDARQADHFAMLFSVLHKSGWAKGARFEHVAFGTILGKDKKPFKTREGGTVRLVEVLAEAAKRAATASDKKLEEVPAQERAELARAIGVGAVKYADLSSDRIKDYVFDWDRMLALEGNTAPYLQNAHVRIRSIFRRGDIDPGQLTSEQVRIEAPEERALALQLAQLPQAIEQVANSLEPHRLCGYLYELASGFHRFYEHCPVLKSEGAVRQSRLGLSALTGRTLAVGLDLLGIAVVERM